MNIRIIAPPADLDAAVRTLRGVLDLRHVSTPRPSKRNRAESIVYIDAVLPDATDQREHNETEHAVRDGAR